MRFHSHVIPVMVSLSVLNPVVAAKRYQRVAVAEESTTDIGASGALPAPVVLAWRVVGVAV